jgi:hypothetical protein
MPQTTPVASFGPIFFVTSLRVPHFVAYKTIKHKKYCLSNAFKKYQ